METANALATFLWQGVEALCGAHQAEGPLLGNLLVGGAAGLVTMACIVLAFRLLISPGEHDPNHPKYRILRADR